jgi:hypothetical protein
MSECPQCQSTVKPEDKFCGRCGYNLHLTSHVTPSLTEHALDVTEVKYRLGIVYLKKDNLQGAIDLWKEVLALNPDHQEARDMLKQAEAQQQAEEGEDG